MSIPQLSIFCLIQGIINYVQINTYQSYIVRICIFINLASNILLLASKKCLLTSQGLVGLGMNCRALKSAGFLLFVYISIALGDPIIKRTRVGIILTVPHFVACSKPGHQFPMSCCGFFCVQMFEVRSSCLFC